MGAHTVKLPLSLHRDRRNDRCCGGALNITRHLSPDLASSIKAKLDNLETELRELEELRKRVKQAELAAKSVR